MAHKSVVIIGSGNWGSAIARIVGHNTTTYQDMFNTTVNMWVFEEMVDGHKLSEIINTKHENVKYLPGKKLPENVVAVTDVVEASKEADILIFVVPHQHVGKICQSLSGKLKDGAKAISLIKGLSVNKTGGIKLISEEIREILNIEVSVLMGANLAHEVADDHFCEATIGTFNKAEDGEMWTKLFNTDNFRISVVKDAHTVELCGALKNIVACAAGFADGLKLGDNTKAALIRIGLLEMMKFIDNYYPGANLETYFESCGVADLVTTCYGGRNRKVCEAFVTANKPLSEVEQELLNGQSAQGPLTAEEIYPMLETSNNLDKFPLFVAVHRICKGDVSPDQLIECIKGRR